jgi:hypothetical protein
MRAIANCLLLTAVATLGFTLAVDGKPRVETGPNAEVTHDGLHRVDRSTMDRAWVKPDLDLRPYTKIMLQTADMTFRQVDDQGKFYRPGIDDQTEFAIPEETRAKLKQTFTDAFREQLERSKRYELVDQRGPHTLVLVATLLDVVSRVPPDDVPGRYEVYLSSVGEATLVVELRDAITNEVLARAADRRAAENTTGFPIQATTASNWAEVRQLANSWATLVRKRLDEFTSIAEG